MASELKIRNLSKSSVKKHPFPYTFLPNPAKGFRALIIAPSGGGKSQLILNLLTRPEFGYAQFFGENIFLIRREGTVPRFGRGELVLRFLAVHARPRL